MKIGKIPESVLKRSVLRQIKTNRKEIANGAGVGEDCAVFMLSGTEAMASCVCAGELIRPREDTARASGSDIGIGRLLMKCANNLAAAGAEPLGAELALFLTGEWEEPQLRSLMAEAELAGAALSMQLAGGHTWVSAPAGPAFASVTGFGRGEKGKLSGKGRPGQDIVVSKWIGLEGTAELARTFREKLCGRYPAYLVEEAAAFDRYLSVAPEAATAVKSGVCAMHDASEGGIFAALWELAERSGTGLTVDLKKLPVRQETVEICEACEANPYELLSGGCLLMAADDGSALVTALEESGIPAVSVGRLTDSNDRIVRNGEETRYLQRPGGDEIYRFREIQA